MSNQVELRIVQGCTIPSGHWKHIYQGSYQIVVRNINGRDRNVSIWTKSKHAWRDIPARPVGRIPKQDIEIWEAPAHNCDEPFAVKYCVDGQIYWDNNNNQNYEFPFAQNHELEAITGINYKIVLGQASIEHGVLNIFAGVQNIGYTKVVGAEYTIEGSPKQKALGFYNRSMSSGLEVWEIEIPVPHNRQVSFSLFYNVNDATYRDDNFGQNYEVSHSVPIIPDCMKRKHGHSDGRSGDGRFHEDIAISLDNGELVDNEVYGKH